MAMRGSPARRIVGNPLGGVLRNLDQRARIAGRTRVSSGPREEDTAPYEATPAPAAVAAPGVPAAAVLLTGEDGRARWRFPAAYGAPPVVSAVAVDPAPDEDDRTVLVALEEVTAWCAVVRVWRSRPRRGRGVAEPAGPGVRVHVMAMAGL
ncbi:hypothetical protein AB0N14_27365 [Streptomyces sp. NPDC051104]|uniref:hypothetical protein n=1 Tax=Streptomyces sp. NPDC051104 TaxID=3155044 RepID=UPI0034287722